MTNTIQVLFNTIDKEKEACMKDYSMLVDCMYAALSDGGKVKKYVVATLWDRIFSGRFVFCLRSFIEFSLVMDLEIIGGARLKLAYHSRMPDYLISRIMCYYTTKMA